VRIEPLIPDRATSSDAASPADSGEFARALDALGQTLSGAQRAEDAFADGGGSLQDAVYARARADVALSAATAAVGRVAAAVQSLLAMQV
jgi:flagellar hook-basal body complex protein FliE